MRRPTREQVIGWVVLVASLLALGIAGYSGLKTRSYVECQAAWSQAYAASARERAAAAAVDRQALDDMVRSVLTATSREQSRAALVTYETARAEADAQRAQHPLPDLPDEVCR